MEGRQVLENVCNRHLEGMSNQEGMYKEQIWMHT